MTVYRKLFTVGLIFPASLAIAACASGGIPPEGQSAPDVGDPVVTREATSPVTAAALTEAPTSFDTSTNGFSSQSDMDTARDIFDEIEQIGDGLGPVYNAQSCRECHQNPVSGAGSQITEFRSGHFNGTNFVDPPGGSLNNDRAINPAIQERILAGQEVRTFRISLSIMGDGFVEAIDSNTLVAIAAAQP